MGLVPGLGSGPDDVVYERAQGLNEITLLLGEIEIHYRQVTERAGPRFPPLVDVTTSEVVEGTPSSARAPFYYCGGGATVTDQCRLPYSPAGGST